MHTEEQHVEDLLRENIRLTRENRKLLKKLWRAEVLGFWSRVLFTLILIGVPVLFYQYYLSGYIGEMRETYQNLRESLTSLGDVSDGSAAAIFSELQERLSDIE